MSNQRSLAKAKEKGAHPVLGWCPQFAVLRKVYLLFIGSSSIFHDKCVMETSIGTGSVQEKMKVTGLRETASSLASVERLTSGLEWLYSKGFSTVTTDKWKDKIKVSFETARKDLTRLADHGYLVVRTSGHKKFYDVIKE